MRKIFIALSVLVCLLASCGGGSSKSSKQTNNQNNNYQTSPAPNNPTQSPDQPIICGNCNGLGTTSIGLRCDVCGGTGFLYMPPGYGAGMMNNNTGGDAGRYLKCAKCSGTGRCFMCEGTGWFVWDGSYGQTGGVKRCEYCYGQGACPTCHGTGQVLR